MSQVIRFAVSALQMIAILLFIAGGLAYAFDQHKGAELLKQALVLFAMACIIQITIGWV